MLNIEPECSAKIPQVLSRLRPRPPGSPPSTPGGSRWQRPSRGHSSETDLDWIKYCLQGGESLSEEVVPDFSQNLNAIFTYTRARRWEGRKKEKNLSLLVGEARRQFHVKWSRGEGGAGEESSLATFHL